MIIIRPEAEADIADAYRYYAAAADGLGEEFLRVVDACLSLTERHPEMCAPIHQDVRRALLRRFPYAILYLVEQERIVVLACFHMSRDPKQWQNRL